MPKIKIPVYDPPSMAASFSQSTSPLSDAVKSALELQLRNCLRYWISLKYL